MATVTKDFKVKNGLVVEGTTGTIDGHDILTKKTDDQNYIIGLIGGSATSDATPDTVVLRDENGSFSADTVTADLVGDVTGNADTATALETARTIELTGDVTGSVSFDGTANVQISTTLDGDFATDAEVSTAKSEAIADAGAYTDGRETAITAAYQAYADQAEADAISTASADATSKADAAEASANSYTDDEVSALDLSLKAYADQAEADAVTSANSYTDGRETAITTAYQAYADQAEVDAKAYTDTAIGNLVDGAPALLDTLNELAAAIADDENFATTVTNSLALKADITYVDSEISDLDTAAQGYANTAESNAQTYTNNAITQEVADRNSAISSAISDEVTNRNTAINAAIAQEVIDRDSAITTAVDAIDTDDIEEGTNNLYFTNQRAIDAVGGTIGDAIDALTTDDIEEGVNNLYYTTARAQDDAASLLTGATLTNIQITGDGNGLTITAENGVADSTTDNLTEGSTNLYFTDARAVSALESVTPDFAAVEIASVAKQVAAEASIVTASTNTAVAWSKTDYRSAEFLVKIANGTHTEVSKVILTLDTSDNIAITEYAMVGTNGSLGSVSADVDGSSVRLRVTTDNNNSDVTVMGTLLA
jgi:hypothetical protein